MQPDGLLRKSSGQAQDRSASPVTDERLAGPSHGIMSNSTSDSLGESSPSSRTQISIDPSPSTKPMAKSRARTMSSAMSFSATFPQSPTQRPDHTYAEYSYFQGSRSRSDTAESATGSVGSPSSSRFGLTVGSPFSVNSDEGYMLGTPSTPVHSFLSPTKSTSPLPSSTEFWSSSPQLDPSGGKGKGKHREVIANTDRASTGITEDSDNPGSEIWPGPHERIQMAASTGSQPLSNPLGDIPKTQPSSLLHSNIYGGPDMPNASACAEGRTSMYDSSGRSTPTPHSTSSSIHSKISSMRVKLRRKGSSLVDVMSFKDRGAKSNEIGTAIGSSRDGVRSRSESITTSATAIAGSNATWNSTLQPKHDSPKKNLLRAKFANKFDFSAKLSEGIQFTMKKPRYQTGSAGTSLGSGDKTGPTASANINTPGLPPSTDANRDLDLPCLSASSPLQSPVTSGPYTTPPAIHLGRVVNEFPIVIPLSPLSPPLLDTKHHSRIDAPGGGIPDFELLDDAPPHATSASKLAVRGSPTPQRVSHFDNKLPPELKLRVFAAILALHKAEHVKADRDVGKGSSKEERADAAQYLNKRWLGEMAGRRELFRISRVSRSWHELAFDGQLWKDFNLHQAIGHVWPSALLMILAKNQGRYVRNLALHGWNHLPPHALTLALTNGQGPNSGSVTTRIQRLDLQGCTSLDADSLRTIIGQSPDLKWISLRGLTAVTGEVVQSIATHANHLQYLDLTRCWRISLLDECIFDGEDSWPALKTLKIGGGVAETGIFEWLARAAPNLETIDVSHSLEISDDDMKDLVSVPTDDYQDALTRGRTIAHYGFATTDEDTGLEPQTIMLTPSQASQLASDFPCDGMIPRRVTKLRHINLSHCPNITQRAAAYLAYAVPHLEILEMANVGEMSSDGIVALLGTTPHIKKIDLEGATQACDRVLAALTFATRKHSVLDPPMPGKELEALFLGHAGSITTDAALRLLRACPDLVQLNLEVSSVHRHDLGLTIVILRLSQ
ncbi:hypothetical protein QFC19_001351 [Naganishia cerealis]|uniref:Uncharacterized protein n=1 Tax=Naganishia cerealis TaxID=610337 RepID=A0ACC2WGS0_9TREE|nr:hypothetical protein QFC19_001351 [Naganishia cerealis]